jgi:tRNA (cmo5U34)-methyltransferase
MALTPSMSLSARGLYRLKTAAEASQHMARFDHEYFPISILEHLELLSEAGFSAVEILWASHLQAGFYALK